MGGLGFMIPGMGCQREEVRWEDKWAGSPALNTVGASLSCGPTSVLGTFLAFSHFTDPGTWELACVHFTGEHTEAQGG